MEVSKTWLVGEAAREGPGLQPRVLDRLQSRLLTEPPVLTILPCLPTPAPRFSLTFLAVYVFFRNRWLHRRLFYNSLNNKSCINRRIFVFLRIWPPWENFLIEIRISFFRGTTLEIKTEYCNSPSRATMGVTPEYGPPNSTKNTLLCGSVPKNTYLPEFMRFDMHVRGTGPPLKVGFGWATDRYDVSYSV